MKLQLLITSLLCIVSVYFCGAYLFYTSHHNGAYDDIDISMQAVRHSTGAMARDKISSHFTNLKLPNTSNYIENILRDGHYEGRSLGWPDYFS